MSEKSEKKDLINTEQDISDVMKELVIARLNVLPSDKKISVGSNGEFTKADLIEHVEKGDEVGHKIVEIELTFLRALKDGRLLEDILISDE